MMKSMQTVSVVIPVYRDGERAVSAVSCLLTQALPETVSLEIIAVDDGSNDGTIGLLANCRDVRVQMLQLAQNQGRSAARNAGAQLARGEVVVFMDSDCLPLDNAFLAAHLDALHHGHVASTGHVFGTGSGFWERYQRDNSLKRERRHVSGETYSGTSSNLAVLKTAFERTGGFDTLYRRYGFEDRDLLLRLCRVGSIAWAGNASVRHLDALTLTGISRKMTEAGEHSAPQFAKHHPTAYKALGYAAIDARMRPWLRPLGRKLGSHTLGIARRIEPTLHKRWMPYPLAKALVKGVSALAFLYGTTRSQVPSNSA